MRSRWRGGWRLSTKKGVFPRAGGRAQGEGKCSISGRLTCSYGMHVSNKHVRLCSVASLIASYISLLGNGRQSFIIEKPLLPVTTLTVCRQCMR